VDSPGFARGGAAVVETVSDLVDQEFC
jgi:hypothetical protein